MKKVDKLEFGIFPQSAKAPSDKGVVSEAGWGEKTAKRLICTRIEVNPTISLPPSRLTVGHLPRQRELLGCSATEKSGAAIGCPFTKDC